MTSTETAAADQRNMAAMICSGFLLVYLCGFTLHPTLEKVGQIGLLLWSLGLCFLRPWRSQPVPREVKWVLGAFLFFFVVAVISHIAGEGGREGTKMLGRYGRFLLVIPLIFLLRRHLTLNGLWVAVAVGMVANAVWGLLEYAAVVEGCTKSMCWPTQVSASLNPIQYGNLILCLTLLFAVAIPVYAEKGRFYALLAWALFAVGMFLMFASHTRGAMITLPFLALVASYAYWRSGLFSLKKALLVVSVTVLCSMSSWQQVSEKIELGVSEYNDYEQLTEESHSSIGTRMHMWRASWKIFLQSPILGVGPGQYEKAAQRLYDQDQAHALAVYRHPHSEFFTVLATRGLLGLFALGMLFLLPLWYFHQALRDDNTQVKSAALGGILIVIELAQAGVTETIFNLTSFLGFYVIMITALVAVISRATETNKELV